MSLFDRNRADLLEAHAATVAYPKEDVIFDALACFEYDLLLRLINTPAPDIANLREKIALYFELMGRPMGDDAEFIALIGEDLDRLFPEHRPQKAKTKASSRKGRRTAGALKEA